MYCETIGCVENLLIIGNGGVGKTSLVSRLHTNTFNQDYHKTIGVDFVETVLKDSSDNSSIRIHILDTAGQENYLPLTSTYYEEANLVLILFSAVDATSFLEVRSWIERLKRRIPATRSISDSEKLSQLGCGIRIPVVIVMNKTDCDSVISATEITTLEEDTGLDIMRICVKDGSGVNDLLEKLIQLRKKPTIATVHTPEPVMPNIADEEHPTPDHSHIIDTAESINDFSNVKTTNINITTSTPPILNVTMETSVAPKFNRSIINTSMKLKQQKHTNKCCIII